MGNKKHIIFGLIGFFLGIAVAVATQLVTYHYKVWHCTVVHEAELKNYTDTKVDHYPKCVRIVNGIPTY